ncbi:glutathione S-transferase family protein [Sulfitobacter litoralis]|uniref:glutathione S-transferase family protein n=1 Tax=Sulfitobacter litoralis TaxID=335975 RepID=UPI002B2674E2|nr:glutathione S-transferase family protein [Sulfitobacter litoralis]
MGLLIDGEWHDKWYDTDATGGKFERSASKFRNWITADGSAGPSGKSGFAAQSGRYHLYVSYACPWAHRALIFRALKGLTPHIDVSVVHPDMLQDGWTFATDFEGATGDALSGESYLRDIYVKADPLFSGRVTVPVLWDKERETIVSNESAEIIRMLNSAFDHISDNTEDYSPAYLQTRIDHVNQRVYDTVNNGVYKAGFATTQEAYDDAVHRLFDSLEWLEEILSHNRFLIGDTPTEADWRLFTTLVRFDLVYHTHFKCNHKRLTDYPNLWSYTRQLYQHTGVAETVHFDHIVRHYYYSQKTVNPHQIIPINPTVDFNMPHGRD